MAKLPEQDAGQAMATTKHSYCRNCLAHCGTTFTVEDNRILAHKPDRENGISHGFMCIKGDMAVDLQKGVEPRLLTCLKRGPGGGFEPIPAAALMDEVAAQLGAIMKAHGPRALALSTARRPTQSPTTCRSPRPSCMSLARPTCSRR